MRDPIQQEKPRRPMCGAPVTICAWTTALALALCAAWGADAPAATPSTATATKAAPGAASSAAATKPTSATASTARYALTTADGKTRIVMVPPATADKILGVMQLLEGPADGVRLAALVSGGLAKLAGANGPATADLAWDGKAWSPAAKMAPGAKIPAWKPADAVADEMVRAEALLADLQANAKDAKSESGKPIVGLAKAEVAGLSDLARQDEFAQPVGEVKQVEKPLEGPNVSGVVKPLTTSRTVPHRVQLWLAPAGAGVAATEGREWTYHVQMAHARAGHGGGFYYVAYADTDGDGQPDRLIARSPLAMSAKDGGWTEWSFASSEHMVFVGNAWIDGATEVFFAEGGAGQEAAWTGLSRDVDVSALFCGLPNLRLSKQAFLTNIRYQIQP